MGFETMPKIAFRQDEDEMWEIWEKEARKKKEEIRLISKWKKHFEEREKKYKWKLRENVICLP